MAGKAKAEAGYSTVTHAGQIVDVVLEAWGIFVVTAVAGSFASFFMSGDQTSS